MDGIQLERVLHIQPITSKANKVLGLLKQTCPLLKDISARRTLYLSLVKSQLSHATEVWSPAHVGLKAKIERMQRRASRWILHSKVGELSYRDRLLKLDVLPLTFDRELKDLVFYKCLDNIVDLNVLNFVSFISHGRTRQSNSFNLKLQYCKSTTYQASYFIRIMKP